jgi:hypothetical protein
MFGGCNQMHHAVKQEAVAQEEKGDEGDRKQGSG